MPYQQTDKRIVMVERGLWIEVDARILIKTLAVVCDYRDSTAVHENLWITGTRNGEHQITPIHHGERVP